MTMSASRFDRLKIRAVAMISTSSPGWRCGQPVHPRREEHAAEPVRRADPHRAGDRLRAASVAALAERKALSMASADAQQVRPVLGERVAEVAAVEQAGAEALLQGADAAPDRGVLGAGPRRRGAQGAGARHREEEAQVVPVAVPPWLMAAIPLCIDAQRL